MSPESNERIKALKPLCCFFSSMAYMKNIRSYAMGKAKGFRHKVRMDLEQYARNQGREATLSLFLYHWFLTPGFLFVFNFRLGQLAGRLPVCGKVLRKLVWRRNSIRFGCEIDPVADIGGGLYTPHPYGIVIGNECHIGENVEILHNVTIGRTSRFKRPEGTFIGDGVTLAVGCAIIGDIRIGDGATVGANAVVLKDVPAGKIAVGNPAVIRG
ncbi:MAG: serine acetyltransferase [Sphingomonadales bacterium]|nr:serine acetyltransferase [Sphingomonadales bacterium]